MGTVCIMLGIISIILFTGAGFFLAGQIANISLMGQTLLEMLKIQSSTPVYIGVTAVFFVIGLFIGLNLIMNGLTYNNTLKIKKLVKVAAKRK